MTAVRHLLKDLDTLRNTREIGGLFAGIASGLVVSMSVFLFFAHFDLALDAAPWLTIPVSLAFACTTISSILAIRAESTGKALAWTFAGNVLPPTVLCLPTIIGVLYATPSGLMAFAVTLPIVLAARGVRAGDPLGADARERLVGALALVVITVAMLAANALIDASEPYYASSSAYAPDKTGQLAAFVPIVTVLAALALAAVTAIPEMRRARLHDRIHRGLMPGMETTDDDGITHVARVAQMAGGPMRGGQSRQTLGAMVVSPARAAVGVALGVGSGFLLLLAGIAAVLSL